MRMAAAESEKYPIIEVLSAAAIAVEQLGSKDKFWYEDENHQWCLFKKSRPGTGEDWAEKAASELAEMLGLLHARYQLAIP